MKIYNILKEEIDEAGNIGYVADDVVSAENDAEVISQLQILNEEGYKHVAQIEEMGAIRLIQAPEII